jgi:hypothetical protein
VGTLLLPLITLAAALQSQPDYPTFSPATLGPIIITPDNVELDGAGIFDFSPDAGAFNVDPPAGGDGISFTVRLWFDATGKPVDCDVGQSRLKQAARTACEQLMDSARFRLVAGMDMPLRRGFLDVRFSFFKDPLGGPMGRQMFANAYPGYTNITIIYPPDETRAEQQIHQGDGKFVISIFEDYPSIALRYRLESQSAVLLGISRDGTIKSCRPISASGLRTAFLDNYTCRILMRRGHFEFTSGAPTYEGLRYLTKSVRWKMPD